MAFKEINISDIPGRRVGGRDLGAMTRDIKAFMDSDANACELDPSGCKSVKSAVYTARQFVWRYKLSCSVLFRDGRLFLIKKEEQQ